MHEAESRNRVLTKNFFMSRVISNLSFSMSFDELYTIAKNKSAILLNNTQIRLTADKDCDYWLFRKNNVNYIGSLVEAPMPKFFLDKPVFKMNNSKNELIGMMQKVN